MTFSQIIRLKPDVKSERAAREKESKVKRGWEEDCLIEKQGMSGFPHELKTRPMEELKDRVKATKASEQNRVVLK